jgi:phosphoglycolate phosphatase-like HAD superfamily hydrolase
MWMAFLWCKVWIKGVLLLDLLSRVGRTYEAVVFVGDKTHNIDNMANALKKAGIDFYGF